LSKDRPIGFLWFAENKYGLIKQNGQRTIAFSARQADDKPCHQLGRLLRKSADKTNRGESCTEYCEPRFVLSEKI